MAAMSDADRNVFSEAYKTALDNFTKEELAHISLAAAELKAVFDAAKKRQQQELKSA